MDSLPPLPVYVINLDHRSDRWEAIRKQCLAAGIHPIRVSAIKKSPGWHGCGLSHKKVAEIAKAANNSWYLVLEDDAAFSINDYQRFINLLPYLWQNRDKWDIFNGGFGSVEHFKLIEKNPIIYEVKGVCSHFYLVNNRAFNAMADWTTEKPELDHYAKNLLMIGTYPFIATQSETKSDLADGYGPNKIIQESEKKIKNLLGLN